MTVLCGRPRMYHIGQLLTRLDVMQLGADDYQGEYMPVTNDLAVAKSAVQIQSTQA